MAQLNQLLPLLVNLPVTALLQKSNSLAFHVLHLYHKRPPLLQEFLLFELGILLPTLRISASTCCPYPALLANRLTSARGRAPCVYKSLHDLMLLRHLCVIFKPPNFEAVLTL